MKSDPDDDWEDDDEDELIVSRTDEDNVVVGCCFPGECCMAGVHLTSECHTAEMLDAQYARECCHYCGKEFEDFSDLGCEFCDRNHPVFGVLP